jgi:integrase
MTMAIRRENGRWVADTRLTPQRRVQHTFDTKTEAIAWLAQMRILRDSGDVSLIKAGNRTIAEMVDYYYQHHKFTTLSAGSKKRYRQLIDDFMRWCGSRHIHYVKHFKKQQANDFAIYVQSKSKGKGPEHRLMTAKMLFNHEIRRDDSVVRVNPFVDVSLPPPTQKPIRYLSEEEFKALLSVMTEFERNTFGLLYRTASRSGEIEHLKWSEVGKSTITILSSEEHRTKTGDSRELPIDDDMMAILAYFLSHRQDAYVLPRAMLRKSHPMLRGMEDIIKRARRRYPQLPFESVTPKVLRATALSHMVQQGVNIKFAQEYVGHKSIRTTEKYYVAIELRNKQSAMQKLLSVRRPESNQTNQSTGDDNEEV